MTPEEVAASFDVSRETMERLRTYVACLERWTRRINLVAPSTLPVIWERHIADSAQLYPLRPTPCERWVDLGAGAGLPGLVIAALAADDPGGPAVTLVEADNRKAAFLATAAREMGVSAEILPRRIEAIDVPLPNVVSARAVAPLDTLLSLAAPIAGPNTVFLFPKGARADFELTEAARHWHYHVTKIASRTNGTATILRLTNIQKARAEP